MEQAPVQCRNGCGFYSNAGTDGLCSVCYKDMIKKKQQPPTGMPASLAPAPGAMASLSIDESSSPVKSSSSMNVETASPTVIVPSSLQTEKRTESECASSIVTGAATASTSIPDDAPPPSTSSSHAANDAETPEDGNKDGKKKKNRCLSCKKKVGLTGFTCRCGGLFCSIHRYSDKHECNFDYKELGAQEIRKSNPVVVATKVQKNLDYHLI